MLIFQGFANSRIVREFPPFSFKVRIATLTRNHGAYSTSGVRMGALTPWFTTLPKWSIRQTMTEYDRNSRKISPSDTGKVICDDSFLLSDAWRKSVWQR